MANESSLVNSQNTTTTNSNNITNHIVINNFSQDNINFISDKFIKHVFERLKEPSLHHLTIPVIIENIKFNSAHKENNNVKITNIRSKVAKKYTNNKWMTVDKNDLLTELYKMGGELLDKWCDEKNGILTDDMKHYHEKYKQITNLVIKNSAKNELNKKAYIYTQNHLI